MIRFENIVEIKRSVEDVFDFIANFENLPLWNHYIIRTRKTADGMTGRGTTFQIVRKADTQVFIITEFVPYRLIALKTIQGSSPRYLRRFTFEHISPDSTRLIDLWEIPTGRNHLAERLAAYNMRTSVAGSLDKLKTLLETESGTAAFPDQRLVGGL
ncbi:MAG: hypothetical protein OHK0046_04250 [Anaerolineae bacterium]